MAKEFAARDDMPGALKGEGAIPVPPAKDSGSKAGLAALISAAVLVAAPMAAKWEGYAPKVYADPVGIPTYCYGETENVTKDPTRIYTKGECLDLLRARMRRDYAPQIAQCLPEVVPNRYIFGALIDASYNAGAAAVCSSTTARQIKAGMLANACRSFEDWYVTARDRRTGVRVKLTGLVNRRKDEAQLCLKGVTTPPYALMMLPAAGDWCDVPRYRPDPLERPPVLRGLPDAGRNA